MKTRRNNKRPKKHGRKTRLKRQRGSGASCSRPTENIDIDMTEEQVILNDALVAMIVAERPERVKQFLDNGAHATITIGDDHGTEHGLPVENIPAIMYVVRHVKDPNTIILNHLLNADSNLNVEGGCAVSRMGTTLLSEAAEWSNVDMVRELLKMGADINDASHRPPALSYAVMNHDIDMINFILSEQKGQVSLTYVYDDERHNIIEEAMEDHENAESETDDKIRTHNIVEMLMKYAVEQSIMSENDFNTKCEKSQQTGKVECGILMNELTNKTAVMPHPPMPNIDGTSETNTSVCFGRSALQKHLLNRFRNPNTRPPIFTNPVTGVGISQTDLDRMFPLGLYADYKQYINNGDQNGGKSKRKTRRKNKKSRKSKRKTRSKRQSGGDVEEYYELIIASRDGDIDRVAMLLENGADVNITDDYNNTALSTAVRNAEYDVVKLLLEKGADINKENNDGNTPLMHAIRFEDYDMVELLLEYPDIDIELDLDTNKELRLAEELTPEDEEQNGIPYLIEDYIVTKKKIKEHKYKIIKQLSNYKRPNVSSLKTMAYHQSPTDVDTIYNLQLLGMNRPYGKLGGKRKTRKSKKSNKKFRTSRKKK